MLPSGPPEARLVTELFRCQDRWGRTVALAEARWRGHILPNHPELAGGEELIERTLTNPTKVTYDRNVSGREVFYRPSGLGPPYSRVLMRVIVEFAVDGTVITAHFLPRPHPQERPKWP